MNWNIKVINFKFSTFEDQKIFYFKLETTFWSSIILPFWNVMFFFATHGMIVQFFSYKDDYKKLCYFFESEKTFRWKFIKTRNLKLPMNVIKNINYIIAEHKKLELRLDLVKFFVYIWYVNSASFTTILSAKSCLFWSFFSFCIKFRETYFPHWNFNFQKMVF